MNPDNDQQLRQLFAESRARDEHLMPSFQRVRARALATQPAGFGYRLAFVAALVVAMAAAGVFVWRAPRPSAQRQVASVGSITEWQSPSDSLLQTPGSEWYGAENLGNLKESL